MDFLKNIAAKLEEFEEQARLVQEEALAKQRAQEKQANRGKPTKEPMRNETRSSRTPVDSDHCPVGELEPLSSSGGKIAGGGLFDNLAEHLDDAYILQEILGQPRCLREWDD